MKIRLVGAEFHADGQADMAKLTVAFRNITKAPKNSFEVCTAPHSTDLFRRYQTMT